VVAAAAAIFYALAMPETLEADRLAGGDSEDNTPTPVIAAVS
jgi:hypothetical protein